MSFRSIIVFLVVALVGYYVGANYKMNVPLLG